MSKEKKSAKKSTCEKVPSNEAEIVEDMTEKILKELSKESNQTIRIERAQGLQNKEKNKKGITRSKVELPTVSENAKE